jgi:Clp amino terminal domain, pathogenicity island component
MFEALTLQARQAMVLAREEARALKHDYLGTEHVLLGLLLEEQGLAGRVLKSFGVTVESVRSEVVRILGSGQEAPPEEIAITPRASTVLELASSEARSFGRNDIDTEHLLLGLLDENEGVAAHILRESDVRWDEIRSALIPKGAARPAEASGLERLAPEPAPSRAGDAIVAPPDPELGWRGRPIALATLGAAVLSRTAFSPSKTDQLEPVAMQLLVRLMVGLPDAERAESGVSFESVAIALACDQDDLQDAARTLARRGLVSWQEDAEDDEGQLSITAAGLIAVRRWLEGIAPRFGRWPPDQPTADDATG